MTGAQFFTLLRIPDEGIRPSSQPRRGPIPATPPSGPIGRGTVAATGDRRRVVQVHTTAAGRQRIGDIWPAYERGIRRVSSPLASGELSELGALLERLAESEEPNID